MPARRKINETNVEEFKELISKGYTDAKLAKHFSCSVAAIKSGKDFYNITSIKGTVFEKLLQVIDKEEFIQYVKDGVENSELQNIYKCSGTSISRLRKEYNISGGKCSTIIDDYNTEEFKQHILDGKTIPELEEIYSCSKTVITNAKRKYNLIGLSPNSKKRDNGDGTKTCATCNEDKSLDNFYSNGGNKLKPNCIPCENAIRNANKTKYIIEILDEKDKKYECEECGYNKNTSALTFHHINKEDKSFGISEFTSISKDRLRLEMEKCICLCANCHAEEHNPEHKMELVLERISNVN